MNCTRCGANLPDNAAFCTNCANPNPSAPQGQVPPGYAPPGYAPPGYGAPPAYGPPPSIPDYLVWSIITTLCCCLPLGIAGIIFSVQCKSESGVGHYDIALQKSKTAFYCNLIGLIVGLLINVVIFAVNFIVAFNEAQGQ